MTPRGAARDAWLLAGLLGLLSAVALARPLLPIDETRYAAVAWEMWDRGSWLVPLRNGEAYHHKPPLLFWIMHAGWALFGVVWGLAVIGILQEIKPRSEARIMSLVIYAVMGWVVVIAIKPLLERIETAGFVWLAAGGLLYTIGIVFYAFDSRFRHWHGIWHLFVVGGSLAHYVAIAFYVI